MLPFTHEQFRAVFAAYNAAVWPAQVLAYVLGGAMVAALLRRWPGSGRFAAAGLALMWAWTGVAYHALHFSAINRAAWAFAALFVAQALLFVEAGVWRRGLEIAPPRGAAGVLGWALIGYAALLYPLLGLMLGHRYPAMPMFGITPCPVTIFSFGVLLLARAPVPRRLWVIPLIWSLVGGSAAMLLAVPQHWVLLFSGASVWLLWRHKDRGTRLATWA
jgi:hypothetical protein